MGVLVLLSALHARSSPSDNHACYNLAAISCFSTFFAIEYSEVFRIPKCISFLWVTPFTAPGGAVDGGVD